MKERKENLHSTLIKYKVKYVDMNIDISEFIYIPL